jgi:predicted enzyme related to lactoylglutathione lyase
MIKEVAFVAVAVTDIDRARKFYEGALGLKPASAPAGVPWVEYELGAVTIGVGSHPDWKQSRDGTSIAFEVDDIDTTIAQMKERGVKFDTDKIETPVCWMAIFRDPDGNRLLVHKRKKQ